MAQLLTDDEMSALLRRDGEPSVICKPTSLLYLQQLLQHDRWWWTNFHEQLVQRFNDLLRQQHFPHSFTYTGMHLIPYGEWSKQQSDIIVLQPINQITLTMSSHCVYQCVESFFGGSISQAPLQRSEFTLMELRLVNRLIPKLIEAVTRLWQHYSEFDVEVGERAYSTESFGAYGEDEPIFVAQFSLNCSSTIELLLPVNFVQWVRQQIIRNDEPTLEAARIETTLLELALDVRPVIAETQCHLDEVLKLACGDVIPLGKSQHAIIKIGNESSFLADYSSHHATGGLTIVKSLAEERG